MIEFDRDVTVTKHVKISAKRFVERELEQIKQWKGEYDFYVKDKTGIGYLVRAITQPVNIFVMDITKFKKDKKTKKYLIETLQSIYEG